MLVPAPRDHILKDRHDPYGAPSFRGFLSRFSLPTRQGRPMFMLVTLAPTRRDQAISETTPEAPAKHLAANQRTSTPEELHHARAEHDANRSRLTGA